MAHCQKPIVSGAASVPVRTWSPVTPNGQSATEAAGESGCQAPEAPTPFALRRALCCGLMTTSIRPIHPYAC